MTILDLVLAVKILGTGLFCAAPFLLLSGQRLGALLGIGPEAVPLVRLYGVAVLALLVGYCSAFSPFIDGQFPWGIVAMGLVSNGFATLTLFLTRQVHKARGMTALIGGITVALAVCAVLPAAVMQPL